MAAIPAERKIEFKSLHTTVKDIDEPKGIVSIYVNAYNNLDSDRDISEPGSFTKTVKENFKRIAHLLDHSGKQRLGWPIEFVTTDPYGLLVHSAMNMKKEMVQDVFSDYIFAASMGRSLEHSIGYQAVKFTIENPEDWNKRIRKIHEYKLFEYSTLNFLGANQLAITQGVKSAEQMQSDLSDLVEMLKGNYTDERLQEIEEKIKEIRASLKEVQPSQDTEKKEPKQIDYKFLINNLKI